jgi:tRNA-modifying protein YgfZ
MSIPAVNSGYIAANRTVAMADRSDRVRLVLAGPDRAKTLHNLTTNDVKRLAVGRGVEAFLTNGQGRTLAYLLIHNEGDRLLVRSDAGTAEAILGHIGKYGVFDETTVTDVTSETVEWHVVGPLSGELARSLGLTLPDDDLALTEGVVTGRRIALIRENPTGQPGLTIVAASEDLTIVSDALRSALEAHSGERLDRGGFESLRIEAGTPVFGADINAANLPQEVNRDDRAINFVKGCYLGQETVARIDALGHVNKILFGATTRNEDVLPVGATLRRDGKDVGVITSSAYSPGWGLGVVLGYAKVAAVVPDATLVAISDGGSTDLVIRRLPMLPEEGGRSQPAEA